MKQNKDRWWQSFYDDTPFDLYLERKDPVELQATIAFLLEKLGIGPGSSVFDQCCGIGSVSIPLAQRGIQVFGVDGCRKYVERARAESRLVGVLSSYRTGDAFKYCTPVACDAAFNWYTSFGYSESDDQNIRMFRRAHQSLKPNGMYAVDYPNMVSLLKNFKPSIVSRLQGDDGEIMLVRESRINLERGLLQQHWTFVMPDGRRLVHDTNLRIYLPHQLTEMLSRSGFTDVQFFGGLNGEALTVDSPRCLVLARRAK